MIKFRLLIFCFASAIPSIAMADGQNWISGNGSVALTRDQTLGQCQTAALQAAKADIFSKAGLEKFSSQQMEICSDTVEATHCELHQQTLNYYEGAYFAGTRNVQTGNSATECTASLEADVRVYKSRHDPSFGLEATISGSKIKRNGEVVQIVGQVNSKAYLNLYVYSPNSTGDQYQHIFPNQFDSTNKLAGNFQIPSSNKSKAYSFFAEFPNDQNGKAVNEWLFLLATKSKFEALDVESSENFHKRLDELGRENWRLEQIGYTILSE